MLSYPRDTLYNINGKGYNDMANEVSKITKEALRQGWTRKPIKGGFMYFSPDGKHIATVHGTPSDRRDLDNTLRDFRAGGLVWPPPRKK